MLLKESSKSPWTARTGPTMSSPLLVGFRDLTQSLWARFLPQLVAHWQDWSWWCWWPTLLVSTEQARLESMNDEYDHCIFLFRSKKEPREGLPECLKNLYWGGDSKVRLGLAIKWYFIGFAFDWKAIGFKSYETRVRKWAVKHIYSFPWFKGVFLPETGQKKLVQNWSQAQYYWVIKKVYTWQTYHFHSSGHTITVCLIVEPSCHI